MGAKPVSYTEWDSDVTGREMPAPLLPGYTIVGEVGRGSMGHVYEASSERGAVAIKVLNLFAENSEMAIERFRREVTVGGRIGHAGIPTVYDSGRLPDGRFFLVMELLRGSDLEDWWEEPGHTRAEALDLICEALEPLAAAHRHGVVHRDLKPENLFVEEDGTVRLLDFGVARDPDASQNLRTATGISVGTPVYMSPEQATKPTTVASPADVWSVGIMLYEALCGELPFDGESPHAVILHACTKEAAPLVDRVPEVHEEVRALVNHCLKKNPLARPADAGVLHASLAALLARAEVRETLVGPAAAPSFRLSHSTAPTQLKQEVSAAIPALIPALASDTEHESLEPASSASSAKKFVLFGLVGLAAAAALGVSVAQMDGTVVEAPEAPTEFSQDAFATAPEPELAPAPIEMILEEEQAQNADEIEDTEETEGVEEAASPQEARAPVRRVRPAREPVTPIEEPEPTLDEEAPESPEPEVVLAEVEEPEVAAPPETPMTAPSQPTPMRPTVATMRPRMRPTMRTQPSEMDPERPGFVTF